MHHQDHSHFTRKNGGSAHFATLIGNRILKLPFVSSSLSAARCARLSLSCVVNCVLTALLSSVLPSAWADNYSVHVDAPKEVKDTLNTYLDIVRYKGRKDIRDEYLDYLIDQTPEQVASLLATQGYFDPRTEVIQNNKKIVNMGAADSEKPDITVKVTLGSRVMIKKANLNVQGMIKEQNPKKVDSLVFDWSLQEDEPFTQADWTLAKTLLMRKIQANAYAAAHFVDTQAVIEPESKTAKVSATLDSGPYFTLGDIQASGLRRYSESVIKNVNVIKVGEAYNRAKLLDLQKRLQNLPYFSSVLVDVGQNPDDAQLAPIKVQVIELPTQNFKGLVGYGTDEGFRTNVQYNYNNVFRKGWIFDSRYNWAQKKRIGLLSLSTPQNKHHFQWSLVGKTEFDQTVDPNTNNQNIGLHYARKLQHMPFSYDLDFYRSKIEGMASHATVLGASWAKNHVDNPSFPRKGYVIEASAGIANRSMGSTASFFRAYGRFRYFIPFFKSDSLLLRTEAGAVLTSSTPTDVPSSLLFYAGGSSSIRGYAYQGIGVNYNNDLSKIYPGKYLATASAEYTHWFNKSWGAAVFYDVGTVTNDISSVQLYQGPGVGVRWHSPVGPINFDLAYGLPHKKILPHLSIGILF